MLVLTMIRKPSPIVISSVTKLPLPDASFDYVYCCQVLEHLPFDEFPQAVSELCRISRKKIIISLPDNRKFFRFSLKLPKLNLEKVISIPKTGKDISIQNHGQHFWEIGDERFNNCMAEREILTLFRHSFNIRSVSHYRFYERPYQHFFVLTKEGQ